MTALDDAGYGGVQAVNRLVIGALEAEPAGAVVLADRARGPARFPRWGAGGSKLRFVALALRRRHLAHHSVTLVTHVGLTPVSRLLKAVSTTKVVVIVHGVEATHPLPRLQRWGMRAADRIVAVSQLTLDSTLRANPFLRCPAVVCHLPARQLPADPTGDGDGSAGEPAPSSRHVLTVGRLWGRGLRKGQDRLIALWPEVLRRVPGARLTIAGDGEGRAALEELAAQHGVSDAVHFTGAVDDAELARLYRRADVFALPSEGEGFGLVLAEAMQFGLPCVASTLDAGSEVVEHGLTGLVVDPRDAPALLDALVTLLSDADLRRRLGEAGRRRVEGRFSLPQFEQRLLQVLEA